MGTIDIHEAKRRLSRLVDTGAGGEPSIIANAGKPLVKVVPIDAPAAAKRPECRRGAFRVPDDFGRMGRDEIENLFTAGR